MPSLPRTLAPALVIGASAFTVIISTDPGFDTAGTATTSAQGNVSPSLVADAPPPTNPVTSPSNTTDMQPPLTPTGNTSPDADAGTTTDSCATATETVGPVVSTEWGPVQVAATVAGGAVCTARTLQYPDDDRKSTEINTRAIPLLDEQAVANGIANIDGVSGATVTSEGYRTSLQAILDSR